MLPWRPLSPDLFHRRRSHSHHTYTVKTSRGWKVTKSRVTTEQGQAAHSGQGWRV